MKQFDYLFFFRYGEHDFQNQLLMNVRKIDRNHILLQLDGIQYIYNGLKLVRKTGWNRILFRQDGTQYIYNGLNLSVTIDRHF